MTPKYIQTTELGKMLMSIIEQNSLMAGSSTKAKIFQNSSFSR
jgi:hypothetical protein